MKKLLCAFLILSLLLAGMSLAEGMGIDGDGWFDGDYPGPLVLIENSGLMFRLPSGWTIKGSIDTDHSYFNQENGLGLWVGTIPDDQVQAFFDYCNNDPTENSAAIILQQDRDWYIIIDPNMKTLIAIAHCEGFPGGIELCFSHVNTPELMTVARQMVSSVQSWP